MVFFALTDTNIASNQSLSNRFAKKREKPQIFLISAVFRQTLCSVQAYFIGLSSPKDEDIIAYFSSIILSSSLTTTIPLSLSHSSTLIEPISELPMAAASEYSAISFSYASSKVRY